MRNHVRHNRSERSRPAFEEGDEREFASTTSDAKTNDADSADSAHSTENTLNTLNLVTGDNTDDAADTAADITEFAESDDAFDEDFADVVRLTCPDCARPIAVFTDEDSLPEHALCPTPWNPFGLTVCDGSGRAVTEAWPPADALRPKDRDEELGLLLMLPAGIDWRTQPFSHVGGPSSRPMRVPEQRLAA